MEYNTLGELYNIDQIEESKRVYHESTGAHLSVRLRRGGIDMSLTDTPRRPIMLPIAKQPRFKKLRDTVKIKVKKG